MTKGIEITASGTRYIGGKPCNAGHVGERFVSNGKCCVCDEIKRGPQSSRSPGRKIRPMPDDFADRLAELGSMGCVRHYGTSTSTISRWRKEAGLAPYKRTTVIPKEG